MEIAKKNWKRLHTLAMTFTCDEGPWDVHKISEKNIATVQIKHKS